MGDKKIAGVSDTMTSNTLSPPRYSIVTDFTQVQFAGLLERIKKLPQMDGFKIIERVEKPEDEGYTPEFAGCITRIGSRIGDIGDTPRPRELCLLFFETTRLAKNKLIVDENYHKRVEELWTAIRMMPELPVLRLKLLKDVNWKYYDAKDVIPPKRFIFLFEYVHPEQEAYEKKIADAQLEGLVNAVAEKIIERQGGKK